MENQEKKVDPTTAPIAPIDEKKEVASTEPEKINYKELLEKERADKEKLGKQLGQAEFTIEKLKKSKVEEEILDDEDETPALDVGEIVEKAVKAAREETTKYFADQTKDTLEEELEKITDPDKRELARFHLENSIVKSGFSRSAIARDISKAIAIIDAPRVKAEKKEIEKALASRDSQGTVSTAGQDVSTDVTKLSEAEEAQVKIIASKSGQTVEKVRSKMIANKKSFI